jgi:hypothetical protein
MTMLDERPADVSPPAPQPSPARHGTRGRWRIAARLARREVRRRPWRTLLTVLLVAVPVAAMVAGDVAYRTSLQADDPSHSFGQAAVRWRVPDTVAGNLELALQQLPADATSDASRVAWIPLRNAGHPDVLVSVQVTDRDDGAAIHRGRSRPTAGRPASGPGEVFLDADVARRLQVGVGDQLSLVRPAQIFTVVGIGVTEAAEMVAPGFDFSALRPTVVQWEVMWTTPELDRALADGTLWQRGDIPSPVYRDVNGSGSLGDTTGGYEIPGGWSEAEDAGTTVFLGWLFGVLLMTVLGVIVAAAFAVSGRRQLVAVGQMSAAGADPTVVTRFLALQGTWTGAAGAGVGVVLGAIGVQIGRRVMDHDGALDWRVAEVRRRGRHGGRGGHDRRAAAHPCARPHVDARRARRAPSGAAGASPSDPVRRGARPRRTVRAVRRHRRRTRRDRRRDAAGDGCGVRSADDRRRRVPAEPGVRRRHGAPGVAPSRRHPARHPRARTPPVAVCRAAGVDHRDRCRSDGAVGGGEQAARDAEGSYGNANVSADVVVLAGVDTGVSSGRLVDPRTISPEVEQRVGAVVGDIEFAEVPTAGTDRTTSTQVYVATDEVLDLMGVGGSVRDLVDGLDVFSFVSYDESGGMFGSMWDFSYGLGKQVDVGTPQQVEVDDLPFGYWVTWVSPAYATARNLTAVPTLVGRADHDLTDDEVSALYSVADDGYERSVFAEFEQAADRTVQVTTFAPYPDPMLRWMPWIRLGSIVGTLALMALIVSLGMALWAAEGRDERNTLVAVGASPSSLARMAGLKAWLLAQVGVLVGVPLGWVILRVVAAAADVDTVFPTVFVLSALLGVPTVIGLVTWASSAIGQRVGRVTALSMAD